MIALCRHLVMNFLSFAVCVANGQLVHMRIAGWLFVDCVSWSIVVFFFFFFCMFVLLWKTLLVLYTQLELSCVCLMTWWVVL